MTAQYDVAIIGGGVTGLSAAFFLRKHHPQLRIVLFEAERQPGGIIRTDHTDGFVIEGGPDSFLSSKPRGLGLARELGMESRLQGTNEMKRRTWVMSNGELHPLPEGLTGLVPSRLEPLLESDLFSAEGKRRLQQEPFVEPRVGDEDESIAAFVERRFGREVYDRMIEPLMAGIYAGDGEELSVAATFPQLRRLEVQYGSVIRGITATSVPSHDGKRPGFLTPMGGMSALVEALVSQLGRVTVQTDSGVQRVVRAPAGFRMRLRDESWVEARAVIVSTSAGQGAALLSDLSQELSDILDATPLGSSASVSLAYRASDVPRAAEGFGYVVPRIENRPILASTWVSSKFAHRAPDGYALIRMFIGRRGAESMLAGTDADLVDLARREASEVLRTNAEPLLYRVFRWPRAMPQYTIGHLDRIATVDALLDNFPGLFVAGNWMGGVGIPDCIASGERAAERAGRGIVEHASEI